MVGGQFAGDEHTDIFMYDPDSGHARLMVNDGTGQFPLIKEYESTLPKGVKFLLAGRFWPDDHTNIATHDSGGTIDVWTISSDLQLNKMYSLRYPGDWTLETAIIGQ